MKVQIKIPRGWRRLRYCEKLKKGDRVFDSVTKPFKWLQVEDDHEQAHKAIIYIRRIASPRKWVPKGYVEVDYLQWQSNYSTDLSKDYRYSDKCGKRLMTFAEWQASPLHPAHTRFFLRKGAK